jgi:hypothetical protein
VVAVFFGGMHAVALLFAVATVVLSLAMKHEAYPRPVPYLGFATAAFDVVGAYPDAVGPIVSAICGAFFAAWLVALGLALRAGGELER